MNKTTVFAACMVAALLFGCKKDIQKPLGTHTTNQGLPGDVLQKDGMLVFSSEAQLYATMNKLGSMRANDRLQWGSNHKIKTQMMVWDEMCLAQEKFEKVKYAGLDENITVEEMAEKGYTPEFCPEIKKQQGKGLVKLNTESDGSIAFELAGINKGFMAVTNEDGFLVVNDTLYQYLEHETKFMKYTSSQNKHTLQAATETDLNNGIYVLKKNTRATNLIIGNIFDQDCNCKVWYYNSSTERFDHWIYIETFTYYVQFQGYRLHSDFWNYSIAEKKLFGIWNTRNNYTPIMYFTASWDWQTTPVPGQPTFSGTGDTPAHSPWSVNFVPFGGVNISSWHLYPSGSTPSMSTDDVEWFDLHFHGSFAGGSSGYSTDYYYN